MRIGKVTSHELAQFIEERRILRSPPWLWRFGFAGGCVLAAFLLRYELAPMLGQRVPLAFFTPAALVAAWYGGVSAGLFALFLGLLLGDYFFLPPVHGFGVLNSMDVTAIITYACTALIGVGVIENLHRARHQIDLISKAAERLQKEMTERARAEDSLRQSEARFRLLMDEAKDYALFMLDQEGKIIEWNAGAQRMKGYTAEQILGQHFSQFYPPEDIALHRPENALAKAEAEGRFEDEGWLMRRDGSRFWANAVITALHDKSGKLVCFSKLVRDATERRRAEEESRKREARFRELADAMPQIVWSTRSNGEVDYVNRKWFEYTGLTAEQTYISQGWTGNVHPEDKELLVQVVHKALKTNAPFQLEKRIRSVTGEYRWHLSRGVPVKDEAGQVVRWFATSTDIEDQKRIEHDLERAREQLAHLAHDLEIRVVERTAKLGESIRSLEGVLYHVAHDLRAPLRAMEGFTQLLLETNAPRFDEAGKDYAWRIISAANRMDQLIKDLLVYGRLTHMEAVCRKVDLETEVDRVLVELESEIKFRRAEVKVYRPLPQAWANSTIINQILSNLVSNALKFIKAGSVPHIEIGGRLENRKVRFWVKDDGIGIDDLYQQQIFRVFERLHDGEGYLGTGIGLAIVRKGAERMGGTVGVESRPGEGSLFWVELPGSSQTK
ncbi:PAS domain S-box protein [Pedosphaera parvula]|uniref:histidine kinase n=1 Tax=Pedosphaera parvula (strain Ellin514) TaxID=320771 RepID=B9XQ37_PEDPL|nr:PAS domain S-box protein [Pedosphaera parvula]EEF58041.1 multi-sensor signal transduction histidine kinase [Pedosphaera parvula Ellin514]